MITSFETNPEVIGELLTKGVQSDLEDLIRKKLAAVVDPIISETAREMAANCVLAISSYKTFGLGDQINLVMNFNNDKAVYTEQKVGS